MILKNTGVKMTPENQHTAPLCPNCSEIMNYQGWKFWNCPNCKKKYKLKIIKSELIEVVIPPELQ
jgi:tRNA(Ile2) C34 agmatinyltransferase TiaS